jgi:hypothetical protein
MVKGKSMTEIYENGLIRLAVSCWLLAIGFLNIPSKIYPLPSTLYPLPFSIWVHLFPLGFTWVHFFHCLTATLSHCHTIIRSN